MLVLHLHSPALVTGRDGLLHCSATEKPRDISFFALTACASPKPQKPPTPPSRTAQSLLQRHWSHWDHLSLFFNLCNLCWLDAFISQQEDASAPTASGTKPYWGSHLQTSVWAAAHSGGHQALQSTDFHTPAGSNLSRMVWLLYAVPQWTKAGYHYESPLQHLVLMPADVQTLKANATDF